ncbi:MAG: undecaprenyldiphospho-muramoylpentapeptide beta-N-acetylglucosaminyltransferase [Longimicrobiales bacterium]
MSPAGVLRKPRRATAPRVSASANGSAGKRVLFAGGGTGGHLYPALALADALREQRTDIRTHFVGARRGVEARVLPDRGVEYTLLPLEPLRRDRVWQNWRLLPASARGLRGLRALFRSFRPDLVVGTGGYASGFAGAYAVAARVALGIQEQNAYPGLTQRVLSRYARQVHLGFPEAERHLKPGARTRIFVLGNPIRPPDPGLHAGDCRAHFGLSRDAVVALIVGGSQGSLAINEALTGALELVAAARLSRPAGLEVLWATGPAHIDAIRARLALIQLEWVHAVDYIHDMPRALAAASLAVSRAGAMATAELLAWGVAAILIPLPTAAADHQRVNAEALAAAGAAIDLPQSQLTAERLWSELTALVGDAARRATMAKHARARGKPDAARQIAQRLLLLLEDRA